MSTGFKVLTPLDVPFSYLYLHVTTERFVGYLDNHTTGVSYPAVRAEDFERAPLRCPAKDVLGRFHESVGPLLQLVSVLEREVRGLQEARELLLPRLMNGAIAV